ncbi:MAG: Mannose-1-phosphate guanylyltransferase fused to cupin domain [Candidatus Methanohalarchaeum thermophilum]|uniref:mannose-1-phosphate guanylyltransferase n=1 Tax=Methanohalarchaeum thermophilum TaxID=1903181 RepID=A0A1Q6DT12_METT1|nr:MAG: Mannose-1-phosphate guanylyltransferase fused to cupin domain [Candidatus Methanohalarchaeum thermophilum]
MLGLILAGGMGTRLWPVSRELYPKQFLSLNGDQSLIRGTVERSLGYVDDVLVCTNGDQFFYVRDELEDLVDEENILVEPSKRDTFPAITGGSLFIREKFGDEPFLVLPSDHVLGEDFFELAIEASDLSDEYLITFGVEPSYPATGYGYINPGKELDTGYVVDSFKEKPSEEEARDFLDDGYYWNSGIFLFKPSVYEKELKRNSPNVYSGEQSYSEFMDGYEDYDSISVDYALMEKSDKVATVPYSGKWKDIGSWNSVFELMEKDENGNSVKGDVKLRDSEDNLVYSKNNRLIVGLGLKDLLIADTEDALLVSSKEKAEEVKSLVQELRKENREEVEKHKKVHKPWGHYKQLEESERYGVRHLTIPPNESISLQRHHHRAEHWVIVQGTAEVKKGQDKKHLNENESIYIPKSTKHKIKNPGKIDLHLIEIQTGEYIQEDDIKRFE